MTHLLKDRVAIVTGSSRGIGFSLARGMAQQGATVVLSGTNEVTLQKAANTILDEVSDAKIDFMSGDVSVSSYGADLVQYVLKKYGKIDILINNAGVVEDSLLLRMRDDQWDKVMAINLRGAFLLTKAVLKPMIKARYGRIVNMSSIVGVIGNPGQSNYSASKAGLIGFSKSVAREVAARNVNVNVVAPGYIDTDMTKNLSENLIEKVKKNIPQGRLGTPEDLCGAILFLTSEHSSYITGQVIHVDGGLAM
ncbi:3-oxoacyl-[acyl-carrier-protein] reductase [PVC group bacterium (ex Bugula neritina AB1)]|nr:3-oxoacyl-[acyl-carrier-protein] reductase [PVC group bacterium (ex Bugula neritina AB1)]